MAAMVGLPLLAFLQPILPVGAVLLMVPAILAACAAVFIRRTTGLQRHPPAKNPAEPGLE